MDTYLTFDQNIFGQQTLPFASYIEPEGYRVLERRKRVRDEEYAQHVPQTLAISRDLFASLPQTNLWGKQLLGERGPRWITECAGGEYKARNGAKRFGHALTARDLLKCMSRPAYYAHGRTDQHVDDLEWGRFDDKPDLQTTLVDCLCLDVDMDVAWATEDATAVRRELYIEQQIAVALGLPYRVFRSGRRGHQAVLPLPSDIDRSAASWLLQAYRTLLAPYHQQSNGQIVADASNLEKIVRLAGGRHATSGRLALWVSPSEATLLPMDEQMEMMRHGYCHPRCSKLERQAFAAACKEIADFLETDRFLMLRHLTLPSSIANIFFVFVVNELPDNLLVERYRAVEEEFGDSGTAYGPRAETCNDSPPNRHHAGIADDKSPDATIPNTTDGLSRNGNEQNRAWAQRVWAIEWGENGWWEWISEDGHRGITAAKILFGEDALERLLARADDYQSAGGSPSRARDMRRKTNDLYATHRMNIGAVGGRRGTIVGELSDTEIALIPTVMNALSRTKPIQARNRSAIERVVYVLLLAFRETQTGFIDLSFASISDSIHAIWGETVNSQAIRRHIERLTQNSPECGFALVEEIKVDRNGRNPQSRFRPGSDLRATTFGLGLPYDSEDDYPDKPGMWCRSLTSGRLTYHQFGAKRRGRKSRGGGDVTNADDLPHHALHRE